MPLTAHTTAATAPSSQPHARWSFPKQTPRRPPPFRADAAPPGPLHRGLSKRRNKIPAASSRPGGKIHGGGQHVLPGTGMLHAAAPDSQPRDTHPAAPGGPGRPSPRAPRQPWLPIKAVPSPRGVGKSHGASWKAPLFRGGRRGTEAPRHLRPSRKRCRGFRGRQNIIPPDLRAGGPIPPQGQGTAAPAWELDSSWSRVADALPCPGGCPGPGIGDKNLEIRL